MKTGEDLRRRLALREAEWTEAERNASFTEALLFILERDVSTLCRRNAALVLGKLQEKRSVNGLCRSLRHDETIVREAAADALGEIGDAGAVRSLIHALSDPTAIVRGCALRALVRVGKPSVTPLIEELWDPKPDRREGVREALVHLGAPSVAPLLTAIDCAGTQTRREARTILKRIAPHGALTGLPPLVLKDPRLTPLEKRQSLALLLPVLRFPDLLTYCSVYRHDKTPSIADGARTVLHVIEGESLLRPSDALSISSNHELLRSLGSARPENAHDLLRSL